MVKLFRFLKPYATLAAVTLVLLLKIRQPEIYIFDDTFSALDFKTDAKLRAALKKETKDSTLLIVAQRVSTVMDADQIIVIDEGHIAGMGTHKELLNTCEVYQEIVSSQLSEEEIA